MEKLGPKYIGKVTLSAIRGWILENSLTDQDTVLLHPVNMEAVLEDYQQLYREPMPDPYFLLGVLIEEAGKVSVPENRVVALLNDERVNRPSRPLERDNEPADDGSDVFRCGSCGSIVNEDGVMLEGQERAHAISLLRMRDARGAVHIHGECCQQRNEY
jgi:hypothetical protein